MRSQLEKNKEALCDEIERLSCEKMTDAIAAKLNVYHGALKALCMMEKGWETPSDSTDAYRSADKSDPTPELDGDTEFERVIMAVPIDKAHMVKLTYIFSKHMDGLAAVNPRAYNSTLEQIRELSRS